MPLATQPATAVIAEETLDELLRGRIRVFQPRHGPRVSLDALLLADFAAMHGGARPRRVLDLGCGCGVVALVLAQTSRAERFVGVELQPELARLAERNVVMNGLADRMRIIEGDLSRPAELTLEPGGFDLVVANPPFHAEERGRAAPRVERALARHDGGCTIEDVTRAARRFLAARGRLVLVFPAERLAPLLAALAAQRLVPRILRTVHSVAGEAGRRVLVQAARDYRGGLTILAPLVVHEDDRRTLTAEARRILGG